MQETMYIYIYIYKYVIRITADEGNTNQISATRNSRPMYLNLIRLVIHWSEKQYRAYQANMSTSNQTQLKM